MSLVHPGTRISGDDALNPRAGGGLVATAADGSKVGWRPPSAPGANLYFPMPSSYPTGNGQVASYNLVGGLPVFAGWVTAGDVVSAGKAGGQTIYGGTAASESLTLGSTSHATRGKVALGLGDRLYMSNATGEDSIRLREYTSGGAQRGWVFTAGGVDRFYLNQDGNLNCHSITALSITGVSVFTVSAVAPALIINRTGSGTNRLVYQTGGVADWYIGQRDATGDYVIETGFGAAIRCVKSDLGVIMAHLPTADPVNLGELWNDAGTLKVSAG